MVSSTGCGASLFSTSPPLLGVPPGECSSPGEWWELRPGSALETWLQHQILSEPFTGGGGQGFAIPSPRILSVSLQGCDLLISKLGRDEGITSVNQEDGRLGCEAVSTLQPFSGGMEEVATHACLTAPSASSPSRSRRHLSLHPVLSKRPRASCPQPVAAPTVFRSAATCSLPLHRLQGESAVPLCSTHRLLTSISAVPTL